MKLFTVTFWCAALLVWSAAIAVVGCETSKRLFTEPTGLITIERQAFIDTWAMVTVLAEDYFADAEATCAARQTCARVTEAKARAAHIAVNVRAKIAVPESRLDWAAVKDFIGILVSLRP